MSHQSREDGIAKEAISLNEMNREFEKALKAIFNADERVKEAAKLAFNHIDGAGLEHCMKAHENIMNGVCRLEKLKAMMIESHKSHAA